MAGRNVIRIAITLFILVLIVVSASGWMWTGSHQTAAQSIASRVVLGLCVVAGLVGLMAVWRGRPAK